MKSIVKSLRPSKSGAGFTLTELLIASGLTLIVVGAAGWGWYEMAKANEKTKAQVERRTAVNQALDFIASEVRNARTISDDAASTGFDVADSIPVMALTLPDDRNVVYYLQTAADAGGTWNGPLVLGRWGPPLETGGTYGTGAETTQVLIDKVDDQTQTAACGAGETTTPTTPQGFYACISANERMANLFLNARYYTTQQEDSLNIPADARTYQANTNVFARANVAGGGGTGTTSNPVSSTNPCDIVGGTLTCTNPGGGTGGTLLTFNILDAAFSCTPSVQWDVATEIKITRVNSGGPVVGVTPREYTISKTSGRTEIYIDSEPTPAQKIADPSLEWDTVEVTSVATKPGGAGICYNEPMDVASDGVDDETIVIPSTNTAQTAILKNGDALPANTANGFQGQNSVSGILGPYVRNNTINIGENDVIYLFELGQQEYNSGFDRQDNVVLITAKPASP